MSEVGAAYVAAGAATDIAEGGYVIIDAGELSILVAKLDGEFFAVENRCSHVSNPLDGGKIRRGRIACPLHGAVYDLRTGESLALTLAPKGLRTFPVWIEGGQVVVCLPVD
jgi:nitrite reductase/ring-hydroxylating ferredoxin subunit